MTKLETALVYSRDDIVEKNTKRFSWSESLFSFDYHNELYMNEEERSEDVTCFASCPRSSMRR